MSPPSPLRVLFVGLGWDYKDPRRGRSFEFTNLWDALRRMNGVDADLFPFDEIEATIGRDNMNRRLLARVVNEVPDLVFFFLFEEEFDPVVLERVSQVTTTLNWFADDHWRFDTYSRVWAPRFTWVATTDEESVDRYLRIGVGGVLHTQWGCNHHLYRPQGVDADLPVTFVGQPHGSRREVIRQLRERGMDVKTWGHGWPEGRLSQDQLVSVFNRSKINLNLSNSSPSTSLRTRLRHSFDAARTAWRTRNVTAALHPCARQRRDQIKGRNFEVPGCGAFLLTSEVAELDKYYVSGKEVATFSDVDDLIEKATYFLNNEDERQEIATAGLRRTLNDHTYELRFRDLFERMGLV